MEFRTVKAGGKRLVLQDRDYEILSFLNEMGTCPAAIVALKFFCREGREGDELTDSRIETAGKRLKELGAAKLVHAFKVEVSRSNYYRSTTQAVELLQAKFPNIKQLRPVTTLSLTNFMHRNLVAFFRIVLEKMGEVQGWRSERRLLSEDRMTQINRLESKSPYIPDAVYLHKNGLKTVFEYEHAAKSELQVKNRINEILKLMGAMGNRYQTVHIICSSRAMADKYRRLDEAKAFKVETAKDILTQMNHAHTYEKIFGVKL